MISHQKATRFLFALGVVGALIGSFIWSCRIQHELREDVAANALNPLIVRGDPKGASSPGFVGTQGLTSGQASGFNWRHENMPKMQYVAAGASLTFGTIPVPLGPEGLGEYWGDVIYTTDGVDAATSCDGGICSGLLEMKIPVDIHGGQCCLMGGGLCSTDGGGGLSTYLLNDTASSGVSSGAAAQIVCSASAQTLSLQFLAGPNSGFWVGGIVSHAQFAAPSNASDAGLDAADAADATDANDSGGSGPTISAINPPFFPLEGSTTVTLTGTGFGTTGSPLLTSVAINSVSCGSISVSNSTTATCVTGVSSVANGTGHVNVVLNGGGTLTNGACYLPSLTSTVPGQLHDANFGLSLSGSNVTAWADQLGSRDYTPGGTDFVLTSNWLSSGKNALTSAATGGMHTGSISHATKLSVCQVRDDNGAGSKVFWTTGPTSSAAGVGFVESAGASGSYGVVTGSGGAQNYGMSSGESRNGTIHNYCFTLDETAGTSLASAEYIDGTIASYSSGATPATSGTFATNSQFLFSDTFGTSLVNGSIAIETVAELLWSATQMANAEKCFNLEYAALP
jgi:hypothetical protein